MRQLIQLSTYETCIADPSLSKIIDFIPEEPKAKLEFAMNDHALYPSYQLVIDKFSSKLNCEEMKSFLGDNEILKSYNGDLELFFINCLFYHAR